MTTENGLGIRQIGDGTPVLIVHGWTMSGAVEERDFGPLLSQRTKHKYRQIYVDLPGMGSSPIGNHHDLDSMLSSLSAVVDTYILPSIPTSNFLLIGTSCGAYLARALAYKYASRVDSLLLRVPVVDPLSTNRDVDAIFTPALADETVLSSLSDSDRRKLGGIAVQTPEYISALKRKYNDVWSPAVKACDSDALRSIQADPERYTLRAPMHTPAEPFGKPVLILTGRQDADVGYRDAWGLAECFPRATVVAMDRAHHGFPVDGEDGELFEGLVRNWLGRVEELQRMKAAGDGRKRFNV